MGQKSYLDYVALFRASDNRKLSELIREERSQIQERMVSHGAVLFRGYKSRGARVCEGVLRQFSDSLLDDAYWSTPRKNVKNKTFTATEYPPSLEIELHSEMAYMQTWPRLLCFHAIRVAESGGETTIGDLGEISDALASVLPMFESGVGYRRTYVPSIDIAWQTAFQTSSRAEVESVAKRFDMRLEWIGSDILQTYHRAQGLLATAEGKPLWFNQAHVFHPATLSREVRASLEDVFGPEMLPRVSTFSDGTVIPDQVVHEVCSELQSASVGVEWQSGDVLLLDNTRFMHGRRPFVGHRELHVAMATPSADLVVPAPSFGRYDSKLLDRVRW